MATFYPSERFAGRPLYCDQFLGGGLVYDVETTPWVALDVTWYETGRAHCGDEVVLLFEDGTALRLQALDAGVFYSGDYWVATWPEEKIVADLPEHLRLDGRMAWRVTGVILGSGED